MSPARAEALVKLTMRGLALSFAVVGILFIATPDGVLHRIDQLGDALGSFTHAPRTEEKLWLASSGLRCRAQSRLENPATAEPNRRQGKRTV